MGAVCHLILTVVAIKRNYAIRINLFGLRLGRKIEAIEIHDLGPGRHEVFDELLFAVF